MNLRQSVLYEDATHIFFIYKKLYNSETGEIYDDVENVHPLERLYNYPLFATYFAELSLLYEEKRYLKDAAKIMQCYYQKGGSSFYALDVPVKLICESLIKFGMIVEYDTLRQLFIMHADQILKNHTNYPSHEVSYEQSIVAPAVDLLLQVYQITEDVKYLQEACCQFQVLDSFNFLQPDYYQYENAIRHWDGYWFGKYKLFGDTYPHYWSALTGNAMFELYKCTGEEEFLYRAENSIRGTLSLIQDDGHASCAMIFPITVNGKPAHCFDAYSNDQDWGLYFMMRFYDSLKLDK